MKREASTVRPAIAEEGRPAASGEERGGQRGEEQCACCSEGRRRVGDKPSEQSGRRSEELGERSREHDAFSHPSCIDCGLSGCADGSGAYPPFCATAKMSDVERASVAQEYRDPETYAVMKAASDTARLAFSEGWCRVEETMHFARQMGAQRIGIAVCSGLIEEGRILARVLRANGFSVYGIACKVGAMKKSDFGLEESCCDFGTISCDPLYQARLLNEAGCDLNIVVGLCVGHDILFMREAQAPSTTLVVKDRALVHNPVAALHAVGTASPYNRMMHPARCCE